MGKGLLEKPKESLSQKQVDHQAAGKGSELLAKVTFSDPYYEQSKAGQPTSMQAKEIKDGVASNSAVKEASYLKTTGKESTAIPELEGKNIKNQSV